jgi:glycosyl transferase family 7 (putative galactosyltransferase)
VKVRLIVPRRSDGGHRDRLWAFCRRYWVQQRPEWEIVEGIHDDGPFNRSQAINRAAEGEWDLGVILDADTILDCEPIDRGAELAVETGRLVLPFDVRCLLSRQGTQHILEGYKGAWDRFVQFRQTPDDAYEYISGCQLVPRALWDEIGGFDERFEGWGGEDDAFHAAALSFAGYEPTRDRLKGNAWHLWHRASPHMDTRTATYKQAKALSDRYIDAREDWNVMRALLDEDRASDQVVILVLTTGDRETLPTTLASIEENVSGPVGRRLICVDAASTDLEFEGWDVVAMGPPKGYSPANREAQGYAIGSGQSWIFWMEDDFVFNEPVDLRELQAIMEARPELAQLSLLRQAWYPEEVATGGIIEFRPNAFKQRDGYIEHRAYWTTNPMLIRRSFLAAHEWPIGEGSELRYGRQIFQKPGVYGGIFGKIGDPPRVHHIGQSRAGYGY